MNWLKRTAETASAFAVLAGLAIFTALMLSIMLIAGIEHEEDEQ